jgi:molybdopterin biosynthesis enzyme
MDLDSENPRIARLTPVEAVRTLIGTRVNPAPAFACEIKSAFGRTLAEDVLTGAQPRDQTALRDGLAVASAALADAGPYTPVILSPETRRVDAGDPMPSGTDAVLPLDAVRMRAGDAEAVMPINPGEGVLPPGGDSEPGTVLRYAGERLRALDTAVLTAVRATDKVVVRAPRIRIFLSDGRSSEKNEAVAKLMGRAVAAAGAVVLDRPNETATFEQQVMGRDIDAAIAIGGTGTGRRDAAVRNLARLGSVEVHGIAISPGETAALGFVHGRPVLVLGGRLGAALAAWLLVGRYLVARLCGATVKESAATLPLKRKVTSTIGLTEVIPVRCAGGMAEPLASGYLSVMALSRSDGWIAVPADSEGFAAGSPVAVQPWP